MAIVAAVSSKFDKYDCCRPLSCLLRALLVLRFQTHSCKRLSRYHHRKPHGAMGFGLRVLEEPPLTLTKMRSRTSENFQKASEAGGGGRRRPWGTAYGMQRGDSNAPSRMME
jgi:hypothetical protein